LFVTSYVWEALPAHFMIFFSRSRYVLDISKTFNPLTFRCVFLAVHNPPSLNWHRSVCINIFTTITTTMLRSNKHAQIGYCVSSHEITDHLRIWQLVNPVNFLSLFLQGMCWSSFCFRSLTGIFFSAMFTRFGEKWWPCAHRVYLLYWMTAIISLLTLDVLLNIGCLRLGK